MCRGFAHISRWHTNRGDSGLGWHANRGMVNETMHVNKDGTYLEVHGPYRLYRLVMWHNNIGLCQKGVQVIVSKYSQVYTQKT
jgi:hypothetical protein